MTDLASPVALVGSTGFVGRNLAEQFQFDTFYRRHNIDQLVNDRPATVVCAGAPAAKWQANQDPEADMANLTRLMRAISTDSIKQLVLISTVDVYPDPNGVNESTAINPDGNHAYGRHRYHLEQHARAICDQTTIVRLPALFGSGLKKNLVFDLLHEREEQFTHKDSSFQFYYLGRIWEDITIALESGLDLVNIATEPLTTREIAQQVFDVDYTHETEAGPVAYDMQTMHAAVYGRSGVYLRTADESLADLRAFVARER